MNNGHSSLYNFKKAIAISSELLKDVDKELFFSPYSVVPIIAQILGLNTPLMGTGDSPYSITSIIFTLKNKKELFREAFKIPLSEKRMIIDELSDMIAPILLEDKEAYIALLINTRYKKEIRTTKDKDNFKADLEKKIVVFKSFINRFLNLKSGFGYIVHYGHPSDLYREYNFLEKLPKSIVSQWRYNSYPVVNELLIKNFPGEKTINGWVIFITNHTKELLEDHGLRKRKILQAALLAKKLGANIIGMGGLIASFAEGGKWLSRQIPDVGFSTGHAYTIGNIARIVNQIAKEVGLDILKSKIAIVGAAGSIGSGCAKLMSNRNPKELILIDTNGFDIKRRLRELKNFIRKKYSSIKVETSFELNKLKRADLVIIATNSPSSIIKAEYLKKGAIVIDDAFPKNTSKDLLRERKDFILLEGGIMKLPSSIDVYSSRNMPDLLDLPLTRAISCKETYGCFAEILVLSLQNHIDNYGLGYSSLGLAKEIISAGDTFGFTSAPLQCFDEAVEEKRLQKACTYLQQKNIYSRHM